MASGLRLLLLLLIAMPESKQAAPLRDSLRLLLVLHLLRRWTVILLLLWRAVLARWSARIRRGLIGLSTLRRGVGLLYAQRMDPARHWRVHVRVDVEPCPVVPIILAHPAWGQWAGVLVWWGCAFVLISHQAGRKSERGKWRRRMYKSSAGG